MTILAILSLAGLAFLLQVLWDHYAYHKFYEEGRTPKEVAEADHWRARSLPFLAVGIGLSWLAKLLPAQGWLNWIALGSLTVGIGLLFRAGQRVTTSRTLLALALVVGSLVLLVVAARTGWLPPLESSVAVEPWRPALLAVAVGACLWGASRLSRPG